MEIVCISQNTPHAERLISMRQRDGAQSDLAEVLQGCAHAIEPETLTYTPSLQEEIDGIVNVCTLEFNTHLINSTFKLKCC